MRNFATLTKEERINFFQSFDDVFTDIDGVIWRTYQPLPGAIDCLLTLKNLDKNVRCVTNNATRSSSFLASYLQSLGYQPISEEDICNPASAIVHYLNQNNFRKKIYVIGSSSMKGELVNAGFTVEEDQRNTLKDVNDLVRYIEDDQDIGAVVYEFDVNLNLLMLQKGLTYLKRQDCLFICGSTDKTVPFGKGDQLMWNYHFQKLLSNFSNRKPYQLAKPSMDFKNYIFGKFCITDPQNCLYIGDSLTEDISFANQCGFQTLLVLTGVTRYEDLQDWKYPEHYKPQYYVENLEIFKNIICETLLS